MRSALRRPSREAEKSCIGSHDEFYRLIIISFTVSAIDSHRRIQEYEMINWRTLACGTHSIVCYR